MQALEMNNPEEIQKFLRQIKLSGEGFNTDCLLMDVFDTGMDYPDYLRAEGEDPEDDA